MIFLQHQIVPKEKEKEKDRLLLSVFVFVFHLMAKCLQKCLEKMLKDSCNSWLRCLDKIYSWIYFLLNYKNKLMHSFFLPMHISSSLK